MDPETGASDVLLRFDVNGSEIAERTFRVRRRVWTDDPNDLWSPMHYEAEVTFDGAPEFGATEDGLNPTMRRVLDALAGSSPTAPASVAEIGDALAEDGQGFPLKVRTIQRTLAEKLLPLGFVDGEQPGDGRPGRWWLLDAR